jgi:hypothetical protein
LGAFFAAMPQKTGLSAPIFWLRQKDFRYNPLRSGSSGPGHEIAAGNFMGA